ncbi:uncharacterized protein METZ01_LOCUS326164, partial [marine metagenome]
SKLSGYIMWPTAITLIYLQLADHFSGGKNIILSPSNPDNPPNPQQ